jgi:hypothetical protein
VSECERERDTRALARTHTHPLTPTHTLSLSLSTAVSYILLVGGTAFSLWSFTFAGNLIGGHDVERARGPTLVLAVIGSLYWLLGGLPYNIQHIYSASFSLSGFVYYTSQKGARGSVVVKALCYKPEGHGFDSR